MDMILSQWVGGACQMNRALSSIIAQGNIQNLCIRSTPKENVSRDAYQDGVMICIIPCKMRYDPIDWMPRKLIT